MIKLENIDENENKKIYISRNSEHILLCCLRQTGVQGSKRNASHLPVQKRSEHQKALPNSIKFAIYIGGHRKLLLQYRGHRP